MNDTIKNNGFTENHSNHEIKKQVRSDILSKLKSINRIHNRIFSLTSLNFDLEKGALELGYNIDTCEREEIIFNKQKEILKDINTIYPNNLTINHKTVFDFLKTYPKQYDLMYLDYCGNISEEFLNTLKILKNICNVIYITIYMDRGAGKYQYLFELADKINNYKNLFAKNGFETNKVYEYRNYKSNMCTFKLIKNSEVKIMNKPNTKIKSFNMADFIPCVRGASTREKSWGLFRGKSKLSRLCIGRLLIEAGFDVNKKYKLFYNPKTNQIGLQENIKGYKVYLNGKYYVISSTMIQNISNIKINLSICDAIKQQGMWILQLETKIVN